MESVNEEEVQERGRGAPASDGDERQWGWGS